MPEKRPVDPHKILADKIGAKEARRLRARKHKDRSIWFGLGSFGVIGWSVAVPTLLGVALGYWIDTTWPGRYSWTLMLLLGGLLVGCMSAWYWLTYESQIIEEEETGENDRQL
jgi:ATP synthase protein I